MTVDNAQDIIDSREVIERIEELRVLVNPECTCERTETLTVHDDGCPVPPGADDDDVEELATLEAFAEEGRGFAGWKYGETFIRDSYFKEYAMDFAEEIGAIPADNRWPCTCIDWDQATRELQMDYTSVDFDGVTYWGRS